MQVFVGSVGCNIYCDIPTNTYTVYCILPVYLYIYLISVYSRYICMYVLVCIHMYVCICLAVRPLCMAVCVVLLLACSCMATYIATYIHSYIWTYVHTSVGSQNLHACGFRYFLIRAYIQI